MTFVLAHESAEFVHRDGTIQTTTKSLVSNLSDLVRNGLNKVDDVIIDVMLFL